MLGRLKFDLDKLVGEILDQLPPTVWSSDTAFLDPAIGGGQFVKQIEQRLIERGTDTYHLPLKVSGFETNNMRINYAVNKHNLKGEYGVADFSKECAIVNIEKMNVVGNWPFTSGTGRAPIAVGIMENLLNKGIPNSMAVILHSGFLHTADGGLSKLRKSIFDAGLYKVIFNDVNAFAAGGAKVRTVTIFCKRGYTGEITIVNQNTEYQYDFRKYGYIVDGGNKELTDFLINLRSTREPVLGNTTKNPKDKILPAAVDTNRTDHFKFLKKMSVKGNEYAYAPKDLFAKDTSFNSWRVAVGYRPSGLEMGDPRLGLTTIVEPGVHMLNGPYVYIEAKSELHAQSLMKYLHSEVVERFLLPKTRTSPTLDIKKKNGQTKFIPMLPENVVINTEADIEKFLGINSALKKSMVDNYAY